jgi:tetratricopeptide (TPR) repeat protein
LAALAAAGATKNRLLRSLRLLRAWLPEVEEPLAHPAKTGSGGELLVRLDNGRLAEPSGQLLFNFEAEGATPAVPLSTEPPTAEHWLRLGCDHEETGGLLEAVRAYRQALLVGGPDTATSFNLGNVLYALGDLDGARERFSQAVELQPPSTEAWKRESAGPVPQLQ